jgi:regulator of sigma E protease
MDKLSLALQLILSLSILVVLHEFGHYLPAKWFKTKVEKFYLFFDPYFSLFKKKIGETEWGIGWVPFGGYVKIAGMIDESMDKEQMNQPPQPWEFRSKKPWQRLIIMIGGVTVNFVLGLLIMSMIFFTWGEEYLIPQDAKYGIAVDSIGMKLGLQDGDHIVSVDTFKPQRFGAGFVTKELVINQAKTITVNRGGQNVVLNVKPEIVQEITKFENRKKQLFGLRMPFGVDSIPTDGNAHKAGLTRDMKIIAVNGKPVSYIHEFKRILNDNAEKMVEFTVVSATNDTIAKKVQVTDKGTVGIQLTDVNKEFPFKTQNYGFFESFPKGIATGIDFLGSQIKAFGEMFKGNIKAKDSLGSVFSMASMFDAGWDWKVFWSMTASLSLLLAFFNLLPIPALDGGYVVFLIYEMITGKTPSDRFMEVVNYIGFFLLIGLMIFALGLDVSRLFK